jgi:hypothetical protein
MQFLMKNYGFGRFQLKILQPKKITFTYVGKSQSFFPPAPAVKHLPNWYKEQQPYIDGKKNLGAEGINMTIKKCIPFIDAIAAGYLLFTQKDVWVEQRWEGPWYRWLMDENEIEFHPFEQADKHPLGNPDYKYPKWMNPFSIKTPPGYSTYFKSPIHSVELPFTIFEGFVDTDTFNHPVNFPFVLKDKKFEGLIPAGTPIAQVIPVKRETWQMEFGGEKEKLEERQTVWKLKTKIFNSYKTQFWSRKEYN